MKILIKGGRVIDPKSGTDDILDIYIAKGVIEDIDKDIDISSLEDISVIDADGMIVSPGFIDMHCHLRDPGFDYKENIETGTKSAAKGGFTSVACMPNTNPTIDNSVVVEYIKSKAASCAYINVFPIGSITKGLLGVELSNIGGLKFAGVAAVSDDGKPVMNAGLMRRAMQYCAMFDTLVISHCEDTDLAGDGSVNEGYMSTYLGLKGITRAAEEVMIGRDIQLSRLTGAELHIAHVSTKGGVELVRQAKKEGLKVTAETCPHYFVLTEAALEGYNTNAKMNPPLRTEEDRLAIIEGLKDGTIDAIATDNAPHHEDEKNCEFENAANGIVGFETALGLTITYLYKTGELTLNQVIEKMSVKPAEILNLGKGAIAAGKPADLVIFDTENEYTVNTSEFLSKSKNSPFDGYKLKGSAVYTIVNGKIIMSNGVVL